MSRPQTTPPRSDPRVLSNVDADHERRAQIPDNVSFDEAASISLALATVTCGLWSHHPDASSVNFPAPWEEGGTTKYAGQPALILGGSSSIGQYGQCFCCS